MKKRYLSSVGAIIDYLNGLGCTEFVSLIDDDIEKSLKKSGCNFLESNIKHLQNARSAGFYAIGKALGNRIVPIIIDDSRRDFENLLSPLNEAYYQSLKLFVLQIVFESDRDIHKEDIYNSYEIDVIENKGATIENESVSDHLINDLDASVISVVLRIHCLFEKTVQASCVQDDDLRSFFSVYKEPSVKVLLASKRITVDSIQEFDVFSAIENISGMGYGSLSYFVGNCIAAPFNPHMMVVDDDVFFSDMNALWIRGAGETNSIINVICKNDGAKQRIKSWCENQNIQYINDAKEFNGKMQVSCTVLQGCAT